MPCADLSPASSPLPYAEAPPLLQEYLAISLFPQPPGLHDISLRSTCSPPPHLTRRRAHREDLASKRVFVGPQIST
eukprot:748702-Hanusia_phi.AAC.1